MNVKNVNTKRMQIICSVGTDCKSLSMFVAILEPCLLIRGIIKKKIIAKIIINASMIGTLDMPSLKPKSVHVQDFFLSTNSTRLKTPNPATPPSIVKNNPQ